MTAVLLLGGSLLLAACGSPGPTLAQLRHPAARICEAAADQLQRIPLPSGPAGARSFLTRGSAALGGEVRELRELGGSGPFARALETTAAELDALRFALAGLRAGNDPVVVIKTLEHRLRPLEARADVAWRAVRIPACAVR